MTSTRGRLLVLGGNPLHGSDALDSRMGACLWDLSLGQHTGDEKLQDCRGVFTGRREFQTVLFMLYIIYCSVEVSFRMRQTIENGVPDPR
jgi:hypothetical protein